MSLSPALIRQALSGSRPRDGTTLGQHARCRGRSSPGSQPATFPDAGEQSPRPSPVHAGAAGRAWRRPGGSSVTDNCFSQFWRLKSDVTVQAGWVSGDGLTSGSQMTSSCCVSRGRSSGEALRGSLFKATNSVMASQSPYCLIASPCGVGFKIRILGRGHKHSAHSILGVSGQGPQHI